MLQYIEKEQNVALTENGAVSLATTGSDCLDFFATAGAIRRESDAEIEKRFLRAFYENKDIATKILFFTRDVRGGLGERRVFKVVLKWLANNEPETVNKNLTKISEYGRFDDLLVLLNTPCEKEMLALVKAQLDKDLVSMQNGKEVSLLAKWLPSVNTSNKDAVISAKKIAKSFGLSDAVYRKTLARLRAYIKIIENNLRQKDYTFDYEKQPSKALFKYRSAFIRNDEKRYGEYIAKVRKGEAKLNASVLAPYELLQPLMQNCYLRAISKSEKEVINATWNSRPDYGTTENALAVIDTSGSMYCTGKPIAASVAISLGIYFAERNKGCFKNHFIEFSAKPTLIKIKGETFVDKVRYISSFNEVANTNVEAVFDLILSAAVKNKLPQSELPSKLYFISDMEFDMAVDNAELSNFENAKKKFNEKGYELPQIVFWNVASRNSQQPVSQNERGVALVSGCTPRLFSMVASGEINPLAFMMQVISSERYKNIVA